MEIKYYNFSGYQEDIRKMLRRGFGLRRIWRITFKKFDVIGEDVIYRTILNCCKDVKRELTYKQEYGLRKEIEKTTGYKIFYK